MIWCITGVIIILIMAHMIREMDRATPVCNSCVHYKKCYKNHPEYMKRNTLEHPCCDDFKC